MVAKEPEEETERREVVPGAEVWAEEAGGGVAGEREAVEEQLCVRLERGAAAEGGEEREVEKPSRCGGGGASGAAKPRQAAHGGRPRRGERRRGGGTRSC